MNRLTVFNDGRAILAWERGTYSLTPEHKAAIERDWERFLKGGHLAILPACEVVLIDSPSPHARAITHVEVER